MTLNLSTEYYTSSKILQAEGGWALFLFVCLFVCLFFPFLVVPGGWGLSLDYNIHRCPVSSPGLQSTVWSTLYTLHFWRR